MNNREYTGFLQKVHEQTKRTSFSKKVFLKKLLLDSFIMDKGIYTSHKYIYFLLGCFLRACVCIYNTLHKYIQNIYNINIIHT